MKYSKKYGKFLRVDDVAKYPLRLTIEKVVDAHFQDGEDKPELFFHEENRRLTLNTTNGRILAKELGDETDDWPGAVIELYATKAEFKGKPVDSIGVRVLKPTSEEPTSEGASGKTPPTAGRAGAAGGVKDMDDDIPF